MRRNLGRGGGAKTTLRQEPSYIHFRVPGRPLGYLIFSLRALIRDPNITNIFQRVLGANPGFRA